MPVTVDKPNKFRFQIGENYGHRIQVKHDGTMFKVTVGDLKDWETRKADSIWLLQSEATELRNALSAMLGD